MITTTSSINVRLEKKKSLLNFEPTNKQFHFVPMGDIAREIDGQN
jgi:hypothetical protein